MILKWSPEGSKAQLVNQTMWYENIKKMQRMTIKVVTTVK